MTLTLREAQAVDAIADVLYNFLPGSGNPNTAFPLAANEAGVGDLWSGGSKRPAIVRLLTATLESRRNRFTPLLQAIIRQSLTWRRGRGDPLSREEVIQLNKLLLGVSFKLPELHEKAFLEGLHSSAPPPTRETPRTINAAALVALKTKLLGLASLTPQPRGYAFEHFLEEMFHLYGLNPQGRFRNTGEEIDGSFVLRNDVFLLQAKWENSPVGAAPLGAFARQVDTKSAWSRGLFVSYSGFSQDGLTAFGRSSRSPVICMDGFDLSLMFGNNLDFIDVIDRKIRKVGETGAIFVPVRDLFPGVG